MQRLAEIMAGGCKEARLVLVGGLQLPALPLHLRHRLRQLGRALTDFFFEAIGGLGLLHQQSVPLQCVLAEYLDRMAHRRDLVRAMHRNRRP
jgi:hypothetical protein